MLLGEVLTPGDHSFLGRGSRFGSLFLGQLALASAGTCLLAGEVAQKLAESEHSWRALPAEGTLAAPGPIAGGSRMPARRGFLTM